MAHIRYSIEDKAERIETGTLLYVTTTSYGVDWRSFLHTHYFSELFYVTDGSGRFQVQSKQFDVHKGDFVIINPHVHHTELSGKTDPLACVVLGIEQLSFIFGEYSSGFGLVHLVHDEKGRANFEFLLNQLVDEVREQKPNYMQVCQSMLEILLIQLMRSAKFALSVAPTQKISDECETAKRYIDINGCNEEITLDKLSQLTHISKYYLSHCFTKAYGISPINYLLAHRIQCAKDHLADTNMSIAQVAQTSGFASQSYFSQAFKKSTGLTPAKYRSFMQANDATRGA